MSRTEPNLLGLAAAALLCAGGMAVAAEPSAVDEEPSKVVLSAFVDVQPEKAAMGTAYLRVRFTIADDWHIYWRNPGESGAATKITLTLPEGISAGQPIWPAPERYIAGGDVLDYVHSNETNFFVPLTFATKEAIEASPNIAVHADWFVCNEDKCVIGSGDANAVFKRTRPDGAPPCAEPWVSPEWARIPQRTAPEGLASSWRGAKLAIRVPDAASLTFFEDSPSDTMPRAVNPLRDGAAEGERLILEFAPETVSPGRVVTGVLAVKRKDGALTHHEISIPVSGSAAATDNPQATPKTSDSK